MLQGLWNNSCFCLSSKDEKTNFLNEFEETDFFTLSTAGYSISNPNNYPNCDLYHYTSKTIWVGEGDKGVLNDLIEKTEGMREEVHFDTSLSLLNNSIQNLSVRGRAAFVFGVIKQDTLHVSSIGNARMLHFRLENDSYRLIDYTSCTMEENHSDLPRTLNCQNGARLCAQKFLLESQTRQFKIEDGDILVTMSDGADENMLCKDILWILSMLCTPSLVTQSNLAGLTTKVPLIRPEHVAKYVAEVAVENSSLNAGRNRTNRLSEQSTYGGRRPVNYGKQDDVTVLVSYVQGTAPILFQSAPRITKVEKATDIIRTQDGRVLPTTLYTTQPYTTPVKQHTPAPCVEFAAITEEERKPPPPLPPKLGKPKGGVIRSKYSPLRTHKIWVSKSNEPVNSRQPPTHTDEQPPQATQPPPQATQPPPQKPSPQATQPPPQKPSPQATQPPQTPSPQATQPPQTPSPQATQPPQTPSPQRTYLHTYPPPSPPPPPLPPSYPLPHGLQSPTYLYHQAWATPQRVPNVTWNHIPPPFNRHRILVPSRRQAPPRQHVMTKNWFGCLGM